MARKINKAPVFNPRKHSLRMWNEAIAAGRASPEQAGVAYSGAPMFRKMAGALARTGAPDMPTAPQLSARFWGATPTPVQRATDEQAVAEAELGMGRARAEMPWLGRRAELGVQAIEDPLAQARAAEQREQALHAPALSSAGIANQLALQQLEEQKLRAPIERKQLEEGAPIGPQEALAAAPPQVAGAVAASKLMGTEGAPAISDVNRQQSMGYAATIMQATGLADMLSSETGLLTDVAGITGEYATESQVQQLRTFVDALRSALAQAGSPEIALMVKSQVRAHPGFAEIVAKWKDMQPWWWRGLGAKKGQRNMQQLVGELNELLG